MKIIPTFKDQGDLKLFLDLDGVFAHFDLGHYELTGKWPHEVATRDLWKAIYKAKNFFLTLKFMPEAEQLWDYTKQYHPTFLTGAPSSNTSREHKKQWVSEKFGEQWETIVLPSKDKQKHAAPYHILVDDRKDNIERWNDAGGIGVLHKDVWETIDQLEAIRLNHLSLGDTK